MVWTKLVSSSLVLSMLFFFGADARHGHVGTNGMRTSLGHSQAEISEGEDRRSLTDLMMPGDRVAGIEDRASAICGAQYSINQLDVAIQETVVSYFYAIESSIFVNGSTPVGMSIIRSLEQELFESISGMILWCYNEDSPPVIVRSSDGGGSGRNLLALPTPAHTIKNRGNLRHLTLDEARRLSIVTFSPAPLDEERPDIPCNFPVTAEYCIVLHGMVTIVHHVTSDVSLAAASILDSTEMVMGDSDVFLLNGENPGLVNVSNVEWLGVTEEEAINGGPNGIGGGDREGGEIENSVPVAYAVTVPLLVLAAFALLVARNKARRQVISRDQMLALEAVGTDTVLVGTGDPPRSFHEGLYHYTRHGARYLSTNCPECIETQRNGFFTASDLDTIDEDKYESFEDVSLVETINSSEKDKMERDPSDHRKRCLVSPSDARLGVKHSSIDVHVCNSATCPICSYKPRDVAFVDNSSPMFGSSDGFNEVTEV